VVGEKKEKKLTAKQKWLMCVILDYVFLFIFCVAGFVIYEIFFGNDMHKQAIKKFELIQKGTYKLNWTLAMPMLIGLIAFLIIVLKKNRSFFEGKNSIGAIIALFLFYLVYSLMGMMVSIMVGIVIGTALDDFVFRSLIDKYKAEMEEE